MADTVKLRQLAACDPGEAYVGSHVSFQAAWDACMQPGWMTWALFHSQQGTEGGFANIYVDVLVHLREYAGQHVQVYEQGIAALRQWALVQDGAALAARKTARDDILSAVALDDEDSFAARERRCYMRAVADMVKEPEYVNLRLADGFAIGEVAGTVPDVWEDPGGLGARIRTEVCDIIRKRHPMCPISED